MTAPIQVSHQRKTSWGDDLPQVTGLEEAIRAEGALLGSPFHSHLPVPSQPLGLQPLWAAQAHRTGFSLLPQPGSPSASGGAPLTPHITPLSSKPFSFLFFVVFFLRLSYTGSDYLLYFDASPASHGSVPFLES